MTPHAEAQDDHAHRVQPPAWTCVLDGLPWPCPAARTALAQAYGADRDRLVVQMSMLMAQSAIDLRQPDPTSLYRRFVAWTLPAGRTCRVCGAARHDAIPGVPPSLTPCLVAQRLGQATATAAQAVPPEGRSR